MSTDPSSLLSGRLLARNAAWNLAGIGLPLLAALFVVPRLVEGLGTERFGLLSIVWMAIGYFGLFDLGLGRALTKLAAERLGRRDAGELPSLVVTALGAMVCLGTLAGCLVAALAPWLVGSVLQAPEHLRIEGVLSFRILAASLPFVILSSALIGLLEAHQRFRDIGLVRMALGLATFLGPWTALAYSPSLAVATGVLALARFSGAAAYALQCYRHVPAARRPGKLRKAFLSPLLGFGAWLSVSNLVGPLMVYLDRFVIGAILGLGAVAYYVAPYEFITRLWILPMGLAGVLFPAFSTALAGDGERLVRLFGVAVFTVAGILFPAVALIVLFAPEGLAFWLGGDFAEESTNVLRWLAVGVFINGMARFPSALVQSAGRPDLTAKIYLLELPVYLLLLKNLLDHRGIEGAAMAWTLRILMDTVFLFVLAVRLVPPLKGTTVRLLYVVPPGMVILGLLALPMTITAKGGTAAALSAATFLCALRARKFHPFGETRAP